MLYPTDTHRRQHSQLFFIGRRCSVVYRYERDGTFAMSAKLVSNLSVSGDYMNVADVYNELIKWASKTNVVVLNV